METIKTGKNEKEKLYDISKKDLDPKSAGTPKTHNQGLYGGRT